MNPKLTLNLGLRYDYQGMACPPIKNPDSLLAAFNIDTSACPKDKNNFAPRFGLSYAFDEKTVLRAGFGIFYNRTPAIVVGTAHSQNGIQVTGINLNCVTSLPAPCPTYPANFTAPPAAVSSNPNLFLFARDYVQPYVEQGRIGFERQFAKNLSFSATYLYYHGLHLTRTRDINLFAPVPRLRLLRVSPFCVFPARPVRRVRFRVRLDNHPSTASAFSKAPLDRFTTVWRFRSRKDSPAAFNSLPLTPTPKLKMSDPIKLS